MRLTKPRTELKSLLVHVSSLVDYIFNILMQCSRSVDIATGMFMYIHVCLMSLRIKHIEIWLQIHIRFCVVSILIAVCHKMFTLPIIDIGRDNM